MASVGSNFFCGCPLSADPSSHPHRSTSSIAPGVPDAQILTCERHKWMATYIYRISIYSMIPIHPLIQKIYIAPFQETYLEMLRVAALRLVSARSPALVNEKAIKLLLHQGTEPPRRPLICF